MGKLIWSSSDTARMQGVQHLKGQIYLLFSSFYSILLKQLFCYSICCWAFLLRLRENFSWSLSHLTSFPGAEQKPT